MMMPTELCRMQVSNLRQRLARRAVADPSHRFSHLADLLTWPPLVQFAEERLAQQCMPVPDGHHRYRSGGVPLVQRRQQLMLQLVLEPIILGDDHTSAAYASPPAIDSEWAGAGAWQSAHGARWVVSVDLAACRGMLRPRAALRLLRQCVADARFIAAVWQALCADHPRTRQAAVPSEGLAALVWQLYLRTIDAWWSTGLHGGAGHPRSRDSTLVMPWSGTHVEAMEQSRRVQTFCARRVGLMLPDDACRIRRAPAGVHGFEPAGAAWSWGHPSERQLRRRLKALTGRSTTGRGFAATQRALMQCVAAAERRRGTMTPRAIVRRREQYIRLRLRRWLASKHRCTHRTAARRLAEAPDARPPMIAGPLARPSAVIGAGGDHVGRVARYRDRGV